MSKETEIAANCNVSASEFAAMRAKNGNGPLVIAMNAHAGDDGSDSSDGLTACCRGASMDHLKSHRDAIASEISSRDGSGVRVHFAK
jgi:hypothetical protein